MKKKQTLNGDRPVAFHLKGVNVSEVKPSSIPAKSLPRRLVIPPGTYRVHGQSYTLKREGLYRFLYPMKDNQQRIVYQKDPLTLISSICWLTTHGNKDDHKSYKELFQQALTQKLIRTCGPICGFACELLEQQGIQSRPVGARTTDINSYDCGHALLEVYLDKKWILFDIDLHVAFRNRGKRLSLLELIPLVRKNDYELERLSLSAPFDILGFRGDRGYEENGYDFGFWMETVMHSEATVRKWYHRIMMIPTMYADGASYSTTECAAIREKAESCWPSVCFIDQKDFTKKFYG